MQGRSTTGGARGWAQRGAVVMAVAMASGGEGAQGTLLALAQRADHSWLRELTMDPESDAQMPNKVSRQVRACAFACAWPSATAAFRSFTCKRTHLLVASCVQCELEVEAGSEYHA